MQWIPTTSNLLLPKSILNKKGGTDYASNMTGNAIIFNQYDSKGNVQEYTVENGVTITIIWGYNQTLPIAKIENASYASIASEVAHLQSLSDSGNENDLIIALNTLRSSLPNAMVTTYTHKPLIGISTATDPKRNRITYIYDEFNRLKEVRDQNNNLLSENQYNYIAQ